MSLCTSSFAFSGHTKDQSIFSTASAFKKPAFSRNPQDLPNNRPQLVASIHPKDLAKNQAKPVQVLDITEDSDLIMYEPVKKIKSNKVQPVLSYQSNNNKTHQHKTKSHKLTIADVFDAPVEPKQKKPERAADECLEEGSSLSFISSYSSLDGLDEEARAPSDRKNSDCLILEPAVQNYETDMQSLVMKDDVVRRLNLLNQDNILFNSPEIPLVLFPYNQQPVFEQPQFLKTLPVEIGNTDELVCNVPLSIPPHQINEYIRSMMYNQQFWQPVLNFSDKTIGGFAKGFVEQCEYDSDSYATRSTSVEREMANTDGEKSQSPLFGISYEIEQQEKISMNKLKVQVKEQKTQKAKKQVKKNTNKNETKEKKGRSMNLQLDLNPKQLKIERRLNRLQLLRYQHGAVAEDEEEIKRFGIFEQLDRTESTNAQEAKQCQGETGETRLNDNEIQSSFNQFISECSQAVVPTLGEESVRSKRVSLTPKWNPEGIQDEVFGTYMRMIEEIIEMKVTSQETAVKLLKSFGMDMSLALEAVRENKVLYSETFRLKVKRLRRYGA